MNVSVSLLAAILLLWGCSHIGEPEKNSLSVVDFEDMGPRKVVQIENKKSIDYGPPLEGDEGLEGEDSNNRPVLALDLLPSLYFSIGYVSTIKELEKKNIRVDIVSSFGFSSVVAALYAKYGTANMVEWKMFELFQKLGDKKPFSTEWRNILNSFTEKEFKELKLNQLQKVLIIPHIKSGEIRLDLSEKVSDAISKAVNLSNKSSLMTFNRYDYSKKLASYGADHIYRISLLPEKISFKRPDGFLFGVFSRIKSSTHEDTFSANLKSSDYMDALENISDYLNLVKTPNEAFAKMVFETVSLEAGNN